MDYKSTRQEVFVSGASWWWDGPVITREEHWTDYPLICLTITSHSIESQLQVNKCKSVSWANNSLVNFLESIFDICKYFLANFPHPSSLPREYRCRKPLVDNRENCNRGAKRTPALVVSYLPRASTPHMPQLADPPTTHSRRGQYEFVDITCSRSNKLLPQTGNCEASPIDQQSIPSFPS